MTGFDVDSGFLIVLTKRALFTGWNALTDLVGKVDKQRSKNGVLEPLSDFA